jgi:hypothetical protein
VDEYLVPILPQQLNQAVQELCEFTLVNGDLVPIPQQQHNLAEQELSEDFAYTLVNGGLVPIPKQQHNIAEQELSEDFAHQQVQANAVLTKNVQPRKMRSWVRKLFTPVGRRSSKVASDHTNSDRGLSFLGRQRHAPRSITNPDSDDTVLLDQVRTLETRQRVSKYARREL